MKGEILRSTPNRLERPLAFIWLTLNYLKTAVTIWYTYKVLLFTVKMSSLAPTVVRLRDYLTFINVAYQNHATLQFTPDCLINIIFSVFLLRQNSFELFRFWSNLEKLFQGKNTSEEIPYKCEKTDLLNRPIPNC